MLSEIGFGALLAYSPRGTADISERSRIVCSKVKSGHPATLQRAGEVLKEHCAPNHVLATFFGGDVTLVPMPRSAPLVPGALWPAHKICQIILASGLATRIAPVLKRDVAVQKSAWAPQGERPTVSRHYQSMTAHPDFDMGQRIVIVDDVVTKGSTALAAASRLADVFPDHQITLFALIRTKGLIPDIDDIIEPARGVIRLIDDEGSRQP